MKYFAHFALLAAALVAAVPCASASPYVVLSGSIGFTDSPASYTYNIGTNVFSLTHVTTGSSQPGQTSQPTDGGGSPILYYFYNNPVLDLFSTDQASGDAIWSGTETISDPTPPNDTVTFYGTSFSPPMYNSTSGQVSFTIYGYFADTAGILFPTTGTDSITLNPDSKNPGVGLLTESLAAQTPEPSSLVLLGTGLVSAGGSVMRRRKRSA